MNKTGSDEDSELCVYIGVGCSESNGKRSGGVILHS